MYIQIYYNMSMIKDILDKKQTVINFRTKENIKNKANKIFDKVGLDMSSALNLFLHNVIITNSLPFQIVTENGYTLKEELEMVRSVKDKKNISTHKSVSDMWKDLDR